MKYPKSNRREWDYLRKREFDKWRNQFTLSISEAVNDGVTTKEIETAAWNCAFHVVTETSK